MLALLLVSCLGASAQATLWPLPIVLERELPKSAAIALDELERAVERSSSIQVSIRHNSKLEENYAWVVGIAGQSPTIDRLLAEKSISLSDAPESFCIKRLPGREVTLVIAGRDARGLTYALLEAASGLAGKSESAGVPAEANESPYLRVRSVSVHPFNADVDRSWFFAEEHWKSYFKLLAQSRFNNFILTFTDQTNYLNPPYSYFVEVPGYAQVKISDLSETQRDKNLAMLRRIGELAHERAIDFTLGIWTQLPVEKYVPKAKVTGLPAGDDAAKYCAAGLAELLKQCPTIDGIQFRMNAEAGVSEDQQTAFYHPLFQAIAKSRPKLPLELRFKGLRPETIADAQSLGLDVTISTKFWCEHFGLPYHPTTADKLYRESRYSYGAMLARPHSYRVVYQLWTVGSQRLLLWGDPDYAARFAESCKFGGGEGFEVFAPLTNKGFGNAPGDWRIFANRSLENGKWEFERYWMFYLSFGRLGYNPKCDAEVWQREFRKRFGDAADEIEAAYRSASQILPLITASSQLSGGEWVWWPELDTGDRLQEYMRIQPSDTGQFYAIRNWQATPHWRSDAWDPTPRGYVEDAVAGQLTAKETPLQVSARLREYVRQTDEQLQRAMHATHVPQSGEASTTAIDLFLLARLGEYHAEKKLAATHLAFFEVAKDPARLPLALKHMQAAAAAWEKLAKFADGKYADNLVFGFSPEHGRRKGHHHSGHWKDHLPEVQEDVAYLESLIAKNPASSAELRKFPGETPLPTRPTIEHSAAAKTRSDADLPLKIKLVGNAPVAKVVLHYRTVDQTTDWKQVEMKAAEDGDYQATISHKDILAKFDLQYYFEIVSGSDGGWIYPSRDQRTPYYVVLVAN